MGKEIQRAGRSRFGGSAWSAHSPAVSPDGRGRVESPNRSAGARKLYVEDGARPSKKSEGIGEGRSLGQVRQERQYRAIRDCHEESRYPIDAECRIFHVSRAAYYKWKSGHKSQRTTENEHIAELVEEIHSQKPEDGYRRIRDELEHFYEIPVNDKRVLRICRAKGIKSTIKYSSHGYTRQASEPQYLAENVLKREFYADRPNAKRLTDVTEFKSILALRSTNFISARYWISLTDVSCPSSFVTGTITHWFFKPLKRLWQKPLTPIRCSTATEGSSIQIGSSTQSWNEQA